MSFPCQSADQVRSVRHIENNPTSSGDVPIQPVVITLCGVLLPDDPSLSEVQPNGGDIYEDYPADDDHNLADPELALKIAQEIRELGNTLFKAKEIGQALDKYQSTLSLTSM